MVPCCDLSCNDCSQPVALCKPCLPCAALPASASSSPSLLLMPMLLRGLELTSLLLRLSDTLSAAWVATADGASLSACDRRPAYVLRGGAHQRTLVYVH